MLKLFIGVKGSGKTKTLIEMVNQAVDASNHDVTDVFIDSALRICNNDRDAFERLLLSLDELADSHKVNIVMTSSLPVEDADDTIKRYI